MFGYVTVFRDELRIREFREYKAVYCSLCRSLGREYGIFTRFILSYDCTFYALMLCAVNKTPPCYEKKCCRFNLLKKCHYIKSSEDIFNRAAALSVASVYFKLVDNVRDSGSIKKFLFGILRFLFVKKYNKAKKNYKDICTAVAKMYEYQQEIENREDVHLDLAADPTASMLAEVLSLESDDKNEKLILHTLGYNLGRWIYFMDAADDIADDIKKGNFNPFIRYCKNDDFKEYCNQVLNQCLANICDSRELLTVYNYGEIIDNILYMGLTSRQQKVLSEERNGKKSL